MSDIGMHENLFNASWYQWSLLNYWILASSLALSAKRKKKGKKNQRKLLIYKLLQQWNKKTSLFSSGNSTSNPLVNVNYTEWAFRQWAAILKYPAKLVICDPYSEKLCNFSRFICHLPLANSFQISFWEKLLYCLLSINILQEKKRKTKRRQNKKHKPHEKKNNRQFFWGRTIS